MASTLGERDTTRRLALVALHYPALDNTFVQDARTLAHEASASVDVAPAPLSDDDALLAEIEALVTTWRGA